MADSPDYGEGNSNGNDQGGYQYEQSRSPGDNSPGARDRSRSPRRRSNSPDNGNRRSRSPRERRRQRSGSNDDANERYAPEIRILINSKDAGAVIGKGGCTIKQLRQDFKVAITVADSRTPERVVIICGELKNLTDVLCELFKSIEEKYGGGGGRGRGEEITGKLLIHQSQAGCVIGRQGNQLREFRNNFGVDIKVFSQCCPRSTERIVQMIGRPAAVSKCAMAIVKLLKTWLPKGRNIPYDAEEYDEEFVQEYGGYVDDDYRGNRRGRGGSPNRGRGSGGGTMNRRSSQQVSIPSDLAGVIIGKGGSKIRQIRQDSGADVELSDAALPGDRIITLTGTADQIQNAQYMLQTCVKRHLQANAK